MAKKRVIWAIDLNGSPLNQFGPKELEIYADENDKVNVAIDGKVVNATSIDSWNAATEVIANPELAGNEDVLTGLEVDGTKYKVPEGTVVEANPELSGGESNLSSLQVGDIKYAVPQGGSSVDSTPLFSGQLDFSTDNVILPTVASYNYPEVNMSDVNNWINWLGYPLERMVIKVDVYKPTDTWIPISIPIDSLADATISIMVPLGEAVQIHSFGTGGSEGVSVWAQCMKLQHKFNKGFYGLGTPWEIGECAYSGDTSEFNFELTYPVSFNKLEYVCSVFGAGVPLGKTITYPNMDNNWYSYTVVFGQDTNSVDCSCYHQGSIEPHPAPENGEE